MRLNYVLWLFKKTKVTLSKAAELATMDVYAFIGECKKNEVPVIKITRIQLRSAIHFYRIGRVSWCKVQAFQSDQR